MTPEQTAEPVHLMLFTDPFGPGEVACGAAGPFAHRKISADVRCLTCPDCVRLAPTMVTPAHEPWPSAAIDPLSAELYMMSLPNWRLIPGMLVWLPTNGPDGQPVGEMRIIHAESFVAAGTKHGCLYLTASEAAACWPIASDHGTKGCLLQIARELWGESLSVVQWDDGLWRGVFPFRFDRLGPWCTEEELLAEAMDPAVFERVTRVRA